MEEFEIKLWQSCYPVHILKLCNCYIDIVIRVDELGINTQFIYSNRDVFMPIVEALCSSLLHSALAT
jgi:hypothetical protein